jgi:flagellar basal-body rod modification protein FlgD
MSISPIDALSSAATTPPTPPPAKSPLDPLANQNVFLQLLVAQLKNQDPSNPADGTQFITQLAQFSELSNTTKMAADIATIKAELAPPPTPKS